MKVLEAIRFRMATLFGRSRMNAEMDEELGAHIAHRADDLERGGMARAEAERRARAEFGGQLRFKQEVREAAGGTFVESVAQDVRLAVRMLRKSPGFTLVAVATLALGIGANAVVFGVLNALILNPKNVPQASTLYGLQRQGGDTMLSYPDYVELRDRNRSFDGLAAYALSWAGLDTGKDPAEVTGYEVSGNYFDAMGVQPYLGRFFHGADEHGPNSAPYVVLTHAYWHSHFRDDRSVVGRAVRLNKQPFTIVGVAPPGFQGTLLFLTPDFFVPMVNKEQLDGEEILNTRAKTGVLMALGHLKAGVTPAQAVSDLNAIGAYLEKTYPKNDAKMVFSLAHPGLAGDWLGRPVRAFVAALMLLAGLILLAACANLGSLFAARAADRSREVALRLALGSSRLRILRLVFTEAVLVSLVGGAAGLWGSVTLLQVLSTWQPVPRLASMHIAVNPDANVYWVALLLAVASAFLFGAVPVRQILRTNPYEIIKSGTMGKVGRRISVRDVSLVVQIAICAVLVTASMVAVRGLMRSLHGKYGFEPQNVTLVNTMLTMAGYGGEGIPAMQRSMVDAVAAIPGVKSVGLVSWPPLIGGWVQSRVFSDQTTDMSPGNSVAVPYVYNVSEDYLDAAGTALLAGRTVSRHDDLKAPRVAVVNQAFAGKVLGSTTDAVGRYFKMPDGARVQVVGVVEDGKYVSLTEDREPAMFVPFQQVPTGVTCLVVRSERDPQQLSAAIRSTLRGLDAGLPFDIQAWTKAMDTALLASHVATAALGVLGVMGAMLSVTGIFGMAAYSVSKRQRELGIRIALGAQRKEVLQAALGRAFKLLAVGSAAGLVLGILASRVLASIVYHATPRDPLVLGGVVLAMMMVGLVATWIPARRAMSVDPLLLLREE
jgi:predicted permease